VTEADVAMTDFALTLECGALAVACARTPRWPSANAFVAVFALTALAAALGGIVHGFAPDPSSAGYRVLWPATLLTTIGASAVLTLAAFDLRGVGGRPRRALAVVTLALLAAVLLGVQAFALAVVAYVPASLVLAFAFAARRTAAAACGAAGLILGIVAGGLQQLRYSPADGLSHNAFYHVLQMVALALLFVGARDALVPRGGDAHATAA
jgi:uncharacterized protein DUF6962